MAVEIERKFLVQGDGWKHSASGIHFRQGYLPTDGSCVVRIRTMGSDAALTVKSRTTGISRQEFEYPIPIKDAQQLLDTLCSSPLVEKKRYTVHYDGFDWEIDEFGGENEGLVLAEVELADELQRIPFPDWIGKEVSDDPRFFNVNLVRKPFGKWSYDEIPEELKSIWKSIYD